MAKFGLNQRRHPTPQNIAILFDVLAAAAGIVSGFVTDAAFISHHVSDITSSVLTSLIIPLLLLFKRFFGVEVQSGQTSVPIGEVTAMEEPITNSKQ